MKREHFPENTFRKQIMSRWREKKNAFYPLNMNSCEKAECCIKRASEQKHYQVVMLYVLWSVFKI